jgi:hypothetical protein
MRTALAALLDNEVQNPEDVAGGTREDWGIFRVPGTMLKLRRLADRPRQYTLNDRKRFNRAAVAEYSLPHEGQDIN